ncbi:Phosphatidylinositolglycan class N-domain-containing protein [Phlyctochytrium arcticum]|nr:Phosphatidylinositolglycan class N-domain-containing protein [Phlyctochytrium arcticum]
MTPVPSFQPPPAKRLVLIVGDGLRADKLFEHGMERAPYLKNIVLNEGTWGVSHTRVPTESRPGHVALIAGFYEDVSAVTKGWKMNPVNFDSVFNQSTHTWSFGSPDILPMFAEGATDKSKVETIMYPSESEDFAEDANQLDIWVFDKFRELLKQGQKNTTLNGMLRQDGVVFFLHLLGLDTNGHAHRPYSKEYLENIKLIDTQLSTVLPLFEQFYNNDKKTAYVFTADHGMSNRGNHGDGHPDNTRTPLIAWGSGVAGPIKAPVTGHDEFSKPWSLNDVSRVDVEQADIAPLMSSLIGLDFPMNSVGKLPRKYLGVSTRQQAFLVFANARQILAQFVVKEDSKRESEIFFRPFKPLKNRQAILEAIERHLKREEHSEAMSLSNALTDLSLEGLRYYQTYDWLYLRAIITAGYVGWIAYSSMCTMRIAAKDTVAPVPEPRSLLKTSIACTVALTALLAYTGSPALYYAYTYFPIFFWTQVCKTAPSFKPLLSSVVRSGSAQGLLFKVAAYVVTLEILVWTYFRREILSFALWGIAFIWPLLQRKGFIKQNIWIVRIWMAFCFATSIFPLLPVEKGENLWLIAAGGILLAISGVIAVIAVPSTSDTAAGRGVVDTSSRVSKVLLTEVALVVASIIITIDTALRLRAKTGLPLVNQTCSWMILGMALLLLVFDSFKTGHHYRRRLAVIYLAFAPVFVLLSISYEALFYFCFSGMVLAWLSMEKLIQQEDNTSANGRRGLRLQDLRIVAFFLLFINVAFFGTGNIASVSSFSLESVYRFTTVFDPFLMGALLILKILIPFFFLSSIFAVIHRAVGLPPFSLFLVVLSTTDVMTLNFFYLVRDSGSWLEIGTTISHFIIASAFIVFQILLFIVSHALVGHVVVDGRHPPVAKKSH